MRYLTIAEAAEALNLSVPTVKRYVYEGKLVSIKLPGGQHRIPQSEIERLLSPSEPAPAAASGVETVSPEERIAVLERWVTDLEAEVERLSAALEVVSRYCALHVEGVAAAAGEEKSAPATHRLLVLGPGCRRCDTLYELVRRALVAGGYQNATAERVKDLDAIAAYGPVVTPALVIDGVLVLSGKIPNERDLRALLARYLGPAQAG